MIFETRTSKYICLKLSINKLRIITIILFMNDEKVARSTNNNKE